MPATIEQARDDMLTLFKTAWEANPLSQNLPVLYRDIKGEKPEGVDSEKNPKSWARVTVQHNTGEQTTFPGGGTGAKFTRRGNVFVQILTPLATGQIDADKLSRIAWAAFAGKSTPNGVWFRSVRVNEVGPEGVWFRTNIIANFEYDEQL